MEAVLNPTAIECVAPRHTTRAVVGPRLAISSLSQQFRIEVGGEREEEEISENRKFDYYLGFEGVSWSKVWFGGSRSILCKRGKWW